MTQAANLAQVGSNANSGGTLITSGTAVATTSGTSIDFTSIPSWVKRITVMFSGVSTNGTSLIQVQIGAGSYATSGYLGSLSQNGTTQASLTTGFGVPFNTAPDIHHGIMTINLLSGNVWVASAIISLSNAGAMSASAGSVTLAGTLDRVRITTVNGTDTFDAGSINILYE